MCVFSQPQTNHRACSLSPHTEVLLPHARVPTEMSPLPTLLLEREKDTQNSHLMPVLVAHHHDGRTLWHLQAGQQLASGPPKRLGALKRCHLKSNTFPKSYPAHQPIPATGEHSLACVSWRPQSLKGGQKQNPFTSAGIRRQPVLLP